MYYSSRDGVYGAHLLVVGEHSVQYGLGVFKQIDNGSEKRDPCNRKAYLASTNIPIMAVQRGLPASDFAICSQAVSQSGT